MKTEETNHTAGGSRVDRRVRAHLTRAARVDAVLDWLRPIAEPVAVVVEFARWISARNADPDQSEDWCTVCAKVEVDRLNAIHPDHEYIVDGGWGSSTDSPPYCCKCGKTLDDHLTEYAILDEAYHYRRNAVRLSGKCGPDRAFRFIQVLSAHDFNTNNPAIWSFFRKIERMHMRRRSNAEVRR